MEKQLDTTENDRKKRYLRSYQEHVQKVHRITDEIAEIRSMQLPQSPGISDMPHGSGGSKDLSDYAARLEERTEKLIDERCECIKAYLDVVRRIDRLCRRESDVLFYRYIKGLEWEEVGEKFGFTDRWAKKTHGKALAKLRIPENFV